MKVAIIGTWHVHTKEYTNAIVENPKAHLACVWDDDAQRGAEFAKNFDVPFVSDYNEILENKDIDSVVICTATYQHPEIIKSAAKAGKHIFTEKVFAFTQAQAVEMAEIVDNYAGKFTICYPHCTFSKVRFLKELCDKDAFGKITYMRVRNVHNGATANWLPEHFYDKEQCGGGAMMDLGAHPMYLLSWFMGQPVSISSTFTSVTGRAVEDNAVSTIEFADGAIGVSETGFVSSNYPYVIEISGTQGAAMIVGDKVDYFTSETDGKWVTATELPVEIPKPIHHWIDAVVDDTVAPFGTDVAIALSKLMEGAYISQEKGIKYIY